MSEKKVKALSEILNTEVIKIICNACCENGREHKCPMHIFFCGDEQRIAFHQLAGCCFCGSFYKDRICPCRVCPNIRNGECDGPSEHCANTPCVHKNEDVCPVGPDRCYYKHIVN